MNPGPGEYKMLPRLVLISRQLWGQVSRAWECRKQHIDGVSMSSDFLQRGIILNQLDICVVMGFPCLVAGAKFP